MYAWIITICICICVYFLGYHEGQHTERRRSVNHFHQMTTHIIQSGYYCPVRVTRYSKTHLYDWREESEWGLT